MVVYVLIFHQSSSNVIDILLSFIDKYNKAVTYYNKIYNKTRLLPTSTIISTKNDTQILNKMYNKDDSLEWWPNTFLNEFRTVIGITSTEFPGEIIFLNNDLRCINLSDIVENLNNNIPSLPDDVNGIIRDYFRYYTIYDGVIPLNTLIYSEIRIETEHDVDLTVTFVKYDLTNWETHNFPFNNYILSYGGGSFGYDML